MKKGIFGLTLFLAVATYPALAATITTPNMGLVLPVPGTVAGPVWAQKLNTAFQFIDSHDHSPGNGSKIPTSGLNINSDFQIGNFNLINPRSVMFANQASPLMTSSDTNNVYVSNGNLYFNNGSGTPVQLTSGSAVNVGGSGNITGIGGTNAAVTYSDTLKTFSFTQNAGVTASIGAGTYTLFENVAGSNGISLKAPTGLGASYSMTLLPALPSSNYAMSIDGTGAVSAAPLSQSQLAAPVQQSLAPAGSMMVFAGSAAPSGWLLCDGSAVSRTTYSSLFSTIGTTYGAGDGSTTFNLPNTGGRVPMGANGSFPLGSTGGEYSHVLTMSEMPSHNHGGGDHAHSYRIRNNNGEGTVFGIPPGTPDVDIPGNEFTLPTSNSGAIISSQGGGAAHNVVQPYQSFNYIIKF